MRNHLLTAIAAVALIAGPTTASARPHHHRHHSYARNCRGSANTGTVVGAIGGGLLGNAIGHHSVGGTLIGAGVGAVAGHQIAKSDCKHR